MTREQKEELSPSFRERTVDKPLTVKLGDMCPELQKLSDQMFRERREQTRKRAAG